MRNKLKKITTQYHLRTHLIFGIMTAFFLNLNKLSLLGTSIVGSVFLDLDHLLFIWGYGQNSVYAKKAKTVLKDRGIKGFASFVRYNHKSQPGLITHNIYFLFFLLSVALLYCKSQYIFIFVLSSAIHLALDVWEDLLFFGKLNRSWFTFLHRTVHEIHL